MEEFNQLIREDDFIQFVQYLCMCSVPSLSVSLSVGQEEGGGGGCP